MWLSDIADLLTTQGVTTGTIYRDFMPTSPDTVISVYGIGGLGPTYTMTGHVLQEPALQILCRSASLQSAHSAARACYEVLSGLKARDINGVTYHWAEPREEPLVVARDENDRFVVSCTYNVKKSVST